MKEKSCRCGASKKRFKIDIGPFYVGECCLNAGYDDLGNKIGQQSGQYKGSDEKPEQVQQFIDTLQGQKSAESAPGSLDKLKAFFGVKPKADGKLGRGQLMDMTVPQLLELAQVKQILLPEGINKKQIVAIIFERQ